MKIFSTFPPVNILNPNFWLVIWIAKDFIWKALKPIFSIFRFFCTLRLYFGQILSYPNKTYIIGNCIYSAFRWYINLNIDKLTLLTGFSAQGHNNAVTYSPLCSFKPVWLAFLCGNQLSNVSKRFLGMQSCWSQGSSLWCNFLFCCCFSACCLLHLLWFSGFTIFFK